MSNPLSIIRDAVKADLIIGKIVDADAYCRVFGPKYPELTRKQIQDAVLQIVSEYGGGAVWGVDRDHFPPDPAS